MLTCDCGAWLDESGPVIHDDDCIHWDLPADDPADEYSLYARYGL